MLGEFIALVSWDGMGRVGRGGPEWAGLGRSGPELAEMGRGGGVADEF